MENVREKSEIETQGIRALWRRELSPIVAETFTFVQAKIDESEVLHSKKAPPPKAV